MENGWTFTTKTGLYGTDYLQRALVTAIGLGANRPQDAVYPTSEVDAEGKPYNGANKYVMHFPKGQLPPADGFWSLTMYNGEYFFVANPLNRYSISARQNLKANADGSRTSTFRTKIPARTRNRTGSQRRRISSSSCSGSTGRRRRTRRSSTGRGRSRRLSW